MSDHLSVAAAAQIIVLLRDIAESHTITDVIDGVVDHIITNSGDAEVGDAGDEEVGDACDEEVVMVSDHYESADSMTLASTVVNDDVFEWLGDADEIPVYLHPLTMSMTDVCDECNIGYKANNCDNDPPTCFPPQVWYCSRGGPPCYGGSGMCMCND